MSRISHNFLEKCAKIVRIAKSMITFSGQWIVSQTTSMIDNKYPREKIFSSSKVKRVNFIVIHSVASFDTTQKILWFLTSWCQELSAGLLHE